MCNVLPPCLLDSEYAMHQITGPFGINAQIQARAAIIRGYNAENPFTTPIQFLIGD